MRTPDWRIGSEDAVVAPAGVTVLSGPGWTGRFERMSFGAGFHVQLGRLTATDDCEIPVVGRRAGPPPLSAFAVSVGRMTLSLRDWPEVALTRERALLFAPKDGYGLFRIPAGQAIGFFSVALDAEVLAELFDHRAPDRLAPLVEAARRGSIVHAHRLSTATLTLIDSLGEPSETAGLQRLQREAVAIQLLTDLVGAEMADAVEAPALSARETAMVRAARPSLLADLHEAPPASVLAAQAGMGLRRFLRAFEAVHGASPAQLLRQARLAEARRLLEAGDLPLKAIAWQVGYAHVSNFTAAFATEFGAPPRRFQRRRVAAE